MIAVLRTLSYSPNVSFTRIAAVKKLCEHQAALSLFLAAQRFFIISDNRFLPAALIPDRLRPASFIVADNPCFLLAQRFFCASEMRLLASALMRRGP